MTLLAFEIKKSGSPQPTLMGTTAGSSTVFTINNLGRLIA
jgi:hypothetical protein